MEWDSLNGWNLRSDDIAELVQKLKCDMVLYNRYERLSGEWQKRFQDYCIGKKTLPVTYDPFFKRIFNPDAHQDRLSRFISSLLEVPVRVIRILPNEESMLDGGVLLIMDILVQLEDGALANVEVQKVPYLFPGERISCYSSDLVLRQYSRVKGEKGSSFKYGDLKKVYTIVIFEKSTQIFHERGMHYVHRGRTVFDTGLKMELLQEYCLVALDVFREKTYPKDKTEQTAWIAFLATDSLRQAEELAAEFPWLEEIYAEMAEYLHKPEEVLNMYSEALKIMDQNTVQYMIELQQQKMEELQRQSNELQRQTNELRRQTDEVQQQNEALQRQTDEVQQQNEALQRQADEVQQQNEALRHQLEQTMLATITILREAGCTREAVCVKLQESYLLNPAEAEQMVIKYWE